LALPYAECQRCVGHAAAIPGRAGKHRRPTLEGLQSQLIPAKEPRRAAACPKELNVAVEAALSQPDPRPPEGVTKEDWERVLTARRSQAAWQAEDLRRLGPEVQPVQIIASTDDVEVRRPEKRRFLELRTAYVRTAQGYRFLSGSAAMVLNQLYLLLVLGFSPFAWLAAVGFLVCGTLMNMATPLFDAYAMEHTPEAEQGALNSIRSWAWNFGWAVGPYISGLVQEKYGFTPLFINTAVLYGIAIGLTWVFFRPKARRDIEPVTV